MLEGKNIIMNFTLAPSLNDIEEIAAEIIDSLPDEILECFEDIEIEVEDFPDQATEQELDIEDPYELLALYKSGKEISPGVEKKSAGDDDVLMLYRRPILDMWCESGENLATLLRQVVIEEIARHFDFSDEEIDELVQNYNTDLF